MKPLVIISIFLVLLLTSFKTEKCSCTIQKNFKPAGYRWAKDNIFTPGLELGSMDFKLNIHKCKLSNSKITLSGNLAIKNQPLYYMTIFKGKEENDTILLLDTITITNLNGEFSFSEKVKDNEAIYFHLVGFRLHSLDLEPLKDTP